MHRALRQTVGSPRRVLIGLFALIASIGCTFAAAADLWFADSQGVHRLNAETNVMERHIAEAGVVALTIDLKDGALWTTNGSRLFKYDREGVPLLSIDLKSVATNFNAASRLALNPADGGIWVAGGKNVVRLDAAGRTVAMVSTVSNVRDLALTQDASLWVLGTNELSLYDAAGSLLGKADLTAGMQQVATLALDEANSALWLVGAKSAFQVAPSLPLQIRLSVALPEVASAAALVVDTGDLWIAGQSSLFRYGRDGSLRATADLAHRRIANFRALQVEPQTRAAWLGHEKGISRFDDAASLITTLPVSVAATAISAAPAGIVPIVTLVSPADGALVRDPLLPIRLHYDASCFGRPCNFPPDVLGAYVLTATLNGQAIGSAFTFDPATGDAVYTPVARHAEGVNTLTAFVTDSSGRRSKAIESRFTVDSIAPRFLSMSPADGSVFTSPGVTLQGSVDDAAARVSLESFSGASFGGANPTGSPFTYSITLSPGTNSFRLSATDPAGNASLLPFSYTYSTLTLSVTSPSDGSIVDSDRVTVSGTFAGAASATVTVNGLTATVAGNTFTANDVPLRFGANTITVVGTTAQGATATRSFTVTSTFPTISIASPAEGSAVTADHVLVRGLVMAPEGSGVVVNGVVAIVQGGSFYANGVPLELGTTPIIATVTSRTGKSASATVNVTSDGPSPLVVTAEPLEGVSPATVVFRLENRASLPITSFSFDPGGFGSAAATPPGALLAFSYPQPGTYAATLTLIDSAGNRYPQPLVLQFRSASDMDAMFRALWKGMNDALAAGDKPGAMTYLSVGAKQKYGPIFDKLLPNMPEIIASYSPLQRLSAAPRLSEYAINRTIDGTNRIFIIAFVQDETGAWRIDQM